MKNALRVVLLMILCLSLLPLAYAHAEEITVEQAAATEDMIDSFTNAAWDYLGLTNENTAGVSVQNVTPYKADGTELSDEEIPEEGITFEMDLPEGFDPENQDIEIYHFNKDGVWEKTQIVEINVENSKIVVWNKHLNEQIAFVVRPANNTETLDDETNDFIIIDTETFGAGQVTVTFDLDGGTLVDTLSNPSETDENGKLTLPTAEECTKDGYALVAWTKEYESYAPGTEATFTENTTLTAQWDKKYTVTFDGSGGTRKEGEADVSTAEQIILESAFTEAGDEGVALDQNPFKYTDYMFTGWCTDDSNVPTINDKGTVKKDAFTSQKLALYACWAETATVTFDPNYDTSTAHKTQDVPKNVETALNKNVYTRSRYLFAGWYENQECTGTALESITTSEDVTLYAKWIGPVYITGSISGTGADAYVGETLTANVDNAEGITDFSYQWYIRETTTSTTTSKIVGATGKTYVPIAKTAGRYIYCKVRMGEALALSNYKLVGDKPVTAIDETTFPDPVFRSFVSDRYDGNGDGMLSEEEISNIEYIYIGGSGLTSLKGIEFFTQLKELDCWETQLTELDLSKNTALTKLFCNDSQLSVLDLSKNTALTYLDCSGNLLRSLDISNNTALTDLYCSYNFLKSLDISHNSALRALYCGRNDITSLDASQNVELAYLNCSENKLNSLNTGNNGALTALYCYENELSELLVSNNPVLRTLNCSSNQLTGLDISRNPELSLLNCDGNQLSELDVSNNPNLKELYCGNTQLSTLDVSNNIALTSLSCSSNQLHELDLSQNTALTFLNCQNNRLTNLDVSNNPNLTTLWCYDNDLTSLQLENTAKLKNLYCSYNSIASLDISGCPVLLQLVENWEPDESYGEIRYGVRPNSGFSTNDTILCYDKGVTLITDPEAVITITFDKNAPDAEGEILPQRVNRGEEAKLGVCTFNYNEHIFTGWNTEPDGSGTTYTDGATITLSEDITLYAQWIEGYTIRFDKNASDARGTMNPQQVVKGERVTLASNNYYRTGNYTVTGWNTEPDGSGTSYSRRYSFIPNSDMVLYAQWAKTLTITYYSNNAENTHSTINYPEGVTAPLISINQLQFVGAVGKIFDSWNTKPDGSGASFADEELITITENMSLYAQWTDEEDLVTIGENSFPDVVFRQYVQNNLDTNGNGILSNREINAVTRLYLSGREIISLKGIEYFTSLTSLNCEGNYLRTLDVSKNTALTSLNCGWNMLAELDVSKCAKLKTLACASNKLTELNIENCTALEALTCYDNMLSELNLSFTPALSSLSCHTNQLSSLDVSCCPALTTLNCSGNNLSSLDISENAALMSLYCVGNGLTGLSLDSNSALTALSCGGNQFAELNVSCCPELVSLQCGGNQLTELDVGGNAQLKTLVCNGNHLSTLDVSACEALTSLDCSENQLTALDVSNCPALTDLKCNANQLTNLNVEANSFLLGVACEHNQLAELDISNCSGLIMLCESFEPRYNNGVVSYRASASTDFFGGNLRYLSYDEGVEIIIRLEPVPDPDLILPASLTVIDAEAFAGGAFKYVKLPEGVKTIGWHAFVDCPNLLYIYIPEGIESIDAHAFDGADRLTIISTPGSEAESYARLHGFAFKAAE